MLRGISKNNREVIDELFNVYDHLYTTLEARKFTLAKGLDLAAFGYSRVKCFGVYWGYERF
jgi:hypothetical protein